MNNFETMAMNELLEVDGGALGGGVEILVMGKVLTGAAAVGAVGLAGAGLVGVAVLGYYVASKN